MTKKRKEKYYHIASLEKGMRVLELLAQKSALTVSDTARYLGLNRASSHRFLAHLKDLGYVEKDESNRYQLTLKMLTLGNKAAQRFKIRGVASRYMQGLFDTFRESINLGYLNGLEILHLDKINSVEILRIDTPMGDSAPAYCTALGKAILSQMSDEELNNYFSHVHLKPYGPNTILTKKQLRQDLKATRSRGYAIDNEELSPGLICVGAPIFDHTTRARYAISISGPTSRMTLDRIDKMQEELRRICAKLSSIMGLELN